LGVGGGNPRLTAEARKKGREEKKKERKRDSLGKVRALTNGDKFTSMVLFSVDRWWNKILFFF